MCEYGFVENIDFSILKSGNPNGGIDKIDDYVITIDMAKELSMIQRTEKGKQARQYFVNCEKKLKEIILDSYMISDPVKRSEHWIEEEKIRQVQALFICKE